MIDLVKEKSISYKCTGFRFEQINRCVYGKNICGVEHGPRGRHKVITEEHDLRIKRNVARLKQLQETVTSKKLFEKTAIWKQLEEQCSGH